MFQAETADLQVRFVRHNHERDLLSSLDGPYEAQEVVEFVEGALISHTVHEQEAIAVLHPLAAKHFHVLFARDQ